MKTKLALLLSLFSLPLLATASPLMFVISITGILWFLLYAVIICSFAWLIWWLIGKLPFGPVAQQIIRWVFILIAIVVLILLLINVVGGGSGIIVR
jgi:hypothetical protein